MSGIKIKQNHTNLKTIFSYFRHSKLTCDDGDHEENGAVVCHCVLMQRKWI